MNSNYKEIPEFSNYLIFDDGRIYSQKNRKFLKTYRVYTTGNNYVSIYDSARKKKKNVRIANLVAQAFLPKPNSIMNHVEHITTCSDDNVNNLRWTIKYDKERKSNPTCILPEKPLHFPEQTEKPPRVYGTIMRQLYQVAHSYRWHAVVGMLFFFLGTLRG
jgi:hypothetical protein